jgi:hypothetical protein
VGNMSEDKYKKYTIQAKRSIKGEAFFESLISDYSIPHSILGPKDIGIDYICEWVYGDKPTGILFAVQVKTLSGENVRIKPLGKENLNELEKYELINPHLIIDDRTIHYWKGLGMPVYLFAVIQSIMKTEPNEKLECYYRRFTPVLTTQVTQESQKFYKANNGTSFIAFAKQDEQMKGFARDLYIDYMRWSYFKGTITYLNPRSIGLNEFREDNAVFGDLLEEYKEQVCLTFRKTKGFLEQYCEG